MITDFIVYALCDRATHQIRYIGASTKGLARPFAFEGYTHNPALRTWMRNLIVTRDEYVVLVLATAESMTELFELEKRWIRIGAHYDWPLANIHGMPKPPPAAPEDLDPAQPMKRGVRFDLRAWRRDPEVRARLAATPALNPRVPGRVAKVVVPPDFSGSILDMVDTPSKDACTLCGWYPGRKGRPTKCDRCAGRADRPARRKRR